MTKINISQIRDIPTLPVVLTRILSTIQDRFSSAGDMEEIIRNDQALTAKLLAVANSAYYGFRHEITTVSRAVVAIGYQEVRNICLGLSLAGFLHPSNFSNQKLAQLLWLHSLAVSEATKTVIEQTGSTDRDIAFTAGLLHDIGKVILAAFFPDVVEGIIAQSKKGEVGFEEAEKQYEARHVDIGEALAERWELPPVLVEVIGRHHQPSPRHTFFHLTSAVHIADYVVRNLGFKDSYRTGLPALKPLALEGTGMDKADLVRLAKTVQQRAQAIITLWKEMIQATSGG